MNMKTKNLNLSKTVLGELSAMEIGKLKGGLVRTSDSINTKFTKVCECCKTGCPTTVTTAQMEERLVEKEYTDIKFFD